MTFILAKLMLPVYAAEVKTTDLNEGLMLMSPGSMVYTGKPVSLNITVLLDGEQLEQGKDYTVSIMSSGKKVTEMVKTGKYTITVSGINSYSGIIQRTFNIVPVNLENARIEISKNISSGDINEATGEIYSDRLEKLVTVTQDGQNISKWCTLYSDIMGSVVKVTAVIKNGDGVNIINSDTTASADMKKSLDNYEIEQIPHAYYTGSPIEPKITVSNVDGYITLEEGKDYTVSFENNVAVSWRAKVTVTGIGEYSGTIVRYFRIRERDMSQCMVSFANGRKYTAYTGHEISPKVVVRDGYNKTLTEGSDYTVTYRDSSGAILDTIREAGDYKVVVSGKNNYEGTLELNFEIRGEDISDYIVSLRQSKVKADGTVKSPAVTSVKNGIYNILNSTDYTVTYRNSAGEEVTELIVPDTYQVIVSGKNGYRGSTSAEFRILGTDQELTVEKTSYKVYKKSKNIQITAEATGDGTGFTYTSSNPEVASVNEKGVIDIHKIGRVKITVKTAGNILSEPAEEEIYIKVYPYKTTLTQKPFTDGVKQSFRVRWDTQEDVTYYQVRYSTGKTFSTYKTKKVNASSKNYTTQSTKITGLKSNKTYYVKVRAVKVVYNDSGDELKYYGTWSDWKSVKTK